MKVGVLFSGGKDSCFATFRAKQDGHEVICFITMKSKNPDSYMFHTPYIHLVEKQAKEMNIPLIKFETEGQKEEELKDLKNAIQEAKKEFKIEAIITGAIESVYQSSRIAKICEDLDLKVINPLWHKDPEKYWKELLDNNFKVIIVSVSAEGFGEEWRGREITRENIEELIKLSKKFKFHLAFEGGEAETFVYSCPLFNKEIRLE
jgi:asparagine synthase (glutamine-hydrolysing)